MPDQTTDQPSPWLHRKLDQLADGIATTASNLADLRRRLEAVPAGEFSRNTEQAATGRGPSRARHGGADAASSSGRSSGLHASPPAPFTPGGSNQEQGRAT